jgi:histone acetyltransferase (RNA polymerase elongator complex component)
MAKEIPSPDSIKKFIEDSLSVFPPDQERREKQIAFYGGSFTAIPRVDQTRYLGEIQTFLTSGRIDSIRISTRPDALDVETLVLLRENGVKTIEIGAQSMLDEVLLLSKRGHGAEDTIAALTRLKQWGFELGIHLMIGLPGDTLDGFLYSLDRMIELRPDFIRIHPTLVLKGSPLEFLWKNGKYSPLPLDETIEWLKRGILKLEGASISVARIGLQPTKEFEEHLLAGPFHPALHQLVQSAIYYDMAEYLLRNHPNGSEPVFVCHPKEVSNLRGQRNENILKLKRHFKLSKIVIDEKEELSRGCLKLRTQGGEFSMHRKDLLV